MSLVINNLSKTYQQGLKQITILKDLNLQIEQGEIVSIVGESGSGKSTFLSLTAGIDQPDSGEISLDGISLTKMNYEEMTEFRGRNIGFVFQQFHLISHLTALENVLLPVEIHNRKELRNYATELLTQVGLKDRLHHYPSEMSGGENQRVAIARSLVLSPKLVLADEPSGNLDTVTGSSVMKLFFEIMKKNKQTCILVTHSDYVSHLCDKQYRLMNQKLVEIK